MPARECYSCAAHGSTVHWPQSLPYKTCPLCGDATEWVNDATALLTDAADELVAQHVRSKQPLTDFDIYCAQREAERRAEVDAAWEGIVKQLGPMPVPTPLEIADAFDVAFCASHGIDWHGTQEL